MRVRSRSPSPNHALHENSEMPGLQAQTNENSTQNEPR